MVKETESSDINVIYVKENLQKNNTKYQEVIYLIKTEKIYCDYIKDNVVISTKFVKVAEVQKATEKKMQ